MNTKCESVNSETVSHTPGPWHPQGRFVCEEHHRTVAEIFFDGSRGGKALQDANARLIAAAPELLEACKACLLRLDHHDDQSAPEALQARAAIAKATQKAGAK